MTNDNGRADWGATVGLIADLWPKLRSDLTGAQLEIWRSQLGQLHQTELRQTLRDIYASSRYVPKLADVLAAFRERMTSTAKPSPTVGRRVDDDKAIARYEASNAHLVRRVRAAMSDDALIDVRSADPHWSNLSLSRKHPSRWTARELSRAAYRTGLLGELIAEERRVALSRLSRSRLHGLRDADPAFRRNHPDTLADDPAQWSDESLFALVFRTNALDDYHATDAVAGSSKQ